jgi:hypothetical protein
MVYLYGSPCRAEGGCEFNAKASYGLPGHKAKFCKDHKQVNMMYHPSRKCEDCENPKLPALYSLSGPATHCEEHKTDNMINRVERRCASCELPHIVDENSLCEQCNPDFIAQMRGRKEREIQGVLRRDGTLPGFITDRVIDDGGCGKERPDILLPGVGHLCDVEVDEYQHHSYDSLCEITRMFNISNHTTPFFFIRYNPDKYKPAAGLERVTKRQRETMLLQVVKWALSLPPETETDLCRVVYLFYDGFDHTKLPEIKRIVYDRETEHAKLI